ncbi:hypothetical protein ABK040_015724 [Willaertia magna]
MFRLLVISFFLILTSSLIYCHRPDPIVTIQKVISHGPITKTIIPPNNNKANKQELKSDNNYLWNQLNGNSYQNRNVPFITNHNEWQIKIDTNPYIDTKNGTAIFDVNSNSLIIFVLNNQNLEIVKMNVLDGSYKIFILQKKDLFMNNNGNVVIDGKQNIYFILYGLNSNGVNNYYIMSFNINAESLQTIYTLSTFIISLSFNKLNNNLIFSTYDGIYFLNIDKKQIVNKIDTAGGALQSIDDYFTFTIYRNDSSVQPIFNILQINNTDAKILNKFNVSDKKIYFTQLVTTENLIYSLIWDSSSNQNQILVFDKITATFQRTIKISQYGCMDMVYSNKVNALGLICEDWSVGATKLIIVDLENKDEMSVKELKNDFCNPKVVVTSKGGFMLHCKVNGNDDQAVYEILYLNRENGSDSITYKRIPSNIPSIVKCEVITGNNGKAYTCCRNMCEAISIP